MDNNNTYEYYVALSDIPLEIMVNRYMYEDGTADEALYETHHEGVIRPGEVFCCRKGDQVVEYEDGWLDPDQFDGCGVGSPVNARVYLGKQNFDAAPLSKETYDALVNAKEKLQEQKDKERREQLARVEEAKKRAWMEYRAAEKEIDDFFEAKGADTSSKALLLMLIAGAPHFYGDCPKRIREIAAILDDGGKGMPIERWADKTANEI